MTGGEQESVLRPGPASCQAIAVAREKGVTQLCVRDVSRSGVLRESPRRYAEVEPRVDAVADRSERRPASRRITARRAPQPPARRGHRAELRRSAGAPGTRCSRRPAGVMRVSRSIAPSRRRTRIAASRRSAEGASNHSNECRCATPAENVQQRAGEIDAGDVGIAVRSQAIARIP